jgi:hypothetical protein
MTTWLLPKNHEMGFHQAPMTSDPQISAPSTSAPLMTYEVGIPPALIWATAQGLD